MLNPVININYLNDYLCKENNQGKKERKKKKKKKDYLFGNLSLQPNIYNVSY